MVVSSVVSELVLVIACAGAAIGLARKQAGLDATVGVALVGLAASLGALKYGGIEAVDTPHLYVSRLGGVGLTLLGVAWLRRSFPGTWWVVVSAAVATVGASLALLWVDGPWRLPLSIAGVLGTIVGGAAWFRARPRRAMAAVGGAVLEVVAGLVIGTKGVLFGLPRLDYFHVALGTAILMMSLSFPPTSEGGSTPRE